MLVLQIVVQAETLVGEVFTDHRHAEVGAILAAVLLRERVAVVAGCVGAAAGLAQQLLPLFVGQAAAIPVGAGVLAAMVEEADVVVLLFEGADLAFDEIVEHGEVFRELWRQFEVHRFVLVGRCCRRSPSAVVVRSCHVVGTVPRTANQRRHEQTHQHPRHSVHRRTGPVGKFA